MVDDNGGIKFTIKELLSDVRAAIARIEAKLDTKADVASLQNASERLAILERAAWQSAADIHYHTQSHGNLLASRRAIIPVLIGAVGVIGSVTFSILALARAGG